MKVDQSGGPDACWPWLGAGKGNGYGNVRVGKTNPSAHKRAYELFVGPVPDGYDVCHSCDNRWCVNYEAHLFLGTRSRNMADAKTKGRIAGPTKKSVREAVIQEARRKAIVSAHKRSMEKH